MSSRRMFFFALLLMFFNRPAAAQPDAPIVTMIVATPDGRTETLTAPESGLATFTLADGREYAVRPTIHDSAPWNRILVTIFKLGTATEPTTVIGEVEVKRTAPAVSSRTKPAFKISVPSVAPPATLAESSS